MNTALRAQIVKWVGKLSCGHSTGGTSIPPEINDARKCVRGKCGGEVKKIVDVVTNEPIQANGRTW